MSPAARLFDLARIAETAPSPEAALAEWASESDPLAATTLDAVRRRLALGLPVASALEPTRSWLGTDTDRLVAAVALARYLGCAFAPLVRDVARSMVERAQ
ncbi:MAG TPA: hypothetical protein VG408_06335, partial [Actinomycetota bacterium]|nr:hypothetical protein [Actinomycetota bacterium]